MSGCIGSAKRCLAGEREGEKREERESVPRTEGVVCFTVFATAEGEQAFLAVGGLECEMYLWRALVGSGGDHGVGCLWVVRSEDGKGSVLSILVSLLVYSERVPPQQIDRETRAAIHSTHSLHFVPV